MANDMSPSLGEIEELLAAEPVASSVSKDEIEELLAAEPVKQYPSGQEIEELLSLQPSVESDAAGRLEAINIAKPEYVGALQKDLATAEQKRRDTLARIERNEKISLDVERMKKQGATSEDIEAFKQAQGWTEPSFFGALWDSVKRLSQTESSFPLDVKVALEGRSEAVSPLKLLETVVTNPLSPSKWDWKDKDVTARTKQLLSQPIVDRFGRINPEAVAVSDLPRYQQNELMLEYAYRQTKIPKEVWANILTTRGGVLAADDSMAAAKRVMRAVDAAAFNIASAKLVEGKPSEKLEVLKDQRPPIPIEITWDGEKAFANGVPVPDAHRGDGPEELEREGWAAIIDHHKGMMESQAMENWQDIPGLLVPWGGAAKAVVRGATAGAKATGIASKAAKAVESLGKPGEAISAAGRVAARAAPSIVEKVANLEKTAPLTAKALKLSGEALVRTAVPAGAAAYGAPEGMGETAAVATAMLSGLGFAVEKGAGKLYSSKDPLKAVVRTEDYDRLPSYVKKVVDQSILPGQTYTEFRNDTVNFFRALDDVKSEIGKIEAGLVPAETSSIMVDTLAEDPRALKVFDVVSMGGDPNGLTPDGRLNRTDIERLINEQTQRAAEKRAQKGAADSDAAEDFLRMQEKSGERLKEDLKSIPNPILNDRTKLISVLNGEKVDGFQIKGATFIAEAMENVFSTRGKNFAYKLMAQDLLKTLAATQEASNPAQFAAYMKFISNPPDFAKQISKASIASETPKAEVFGTEVPRISKELSTSQLLTQPNPAEELKNVVKLAVDDNMFYREKMAEKGSRPLLANDLRLAKLQQQENLRRYRIKNSIDSEYLEKEVAGLERTEASVLRDLRETRTARVKGKEVTVPGRIEALISQLSDQRMPDAMKRRLIGIVDSLNKNVPVAEEAIAYFPPSIQKTIRSADYLVREANSLRSLKQDALIRAAEVEQRAVNARAANLSKEILYSKPRKAWKLQEAEIRSQLGEFEGVTDSTYFNNVVMSIGKDISDSLARGGGVVISAQNLGYFSLMQNNNFAERLFGIKTFNNKEWGRFRTKLKQTADTLYSLTAEGEKWNENVRILNESISNHRVNVEGMARHLKFMRSAFSISKMQRELDKYAYRIYDIAGKLEGGETLSVKDRQNLVSFMGSSVMQRYRLAKDPSWIVTRAAEADTIFKMLRNSNKEILGYMKEYMVNILGKDANDLNATIASSWFINPTNMYDRAGYFTAALKLAEYYGKGANAPGGRGGAILPWAGSEEYISTVISKNTALAVSNDVGEMVAGRALGKETADKLVSQFFAEINKLKVGNKQYIDFQSSEPFVSFLKKNVIGLKGIEGRLVLDGAETDLGRIYRNWVKAGQTTEALERLVDDWKQVTKVKSVDAEGEKIKRSLSAYWRVQGLTPEMHEMGVQWVKKWQEFDKKKVELWNEDNAKLNKKHGTSVAPFLYLPSRLETDASIANNVKFDNTNFDKLSSMDVLFGRGIASSEAGQNLKAQFNVELKDLMHPQELFMESTQKFFQDLHTREPRRRLWEKGLLMQNGGYQYYATTLAQTLLGSLSVNTPDTAQMIRNYLDKSKLFAPLRALSPLINPNWLLVSLGQVAQNAIQNVQVMALNPYNSKRAFMALLKFAPGFAGGVYDRILKGEDAISATSVVARVPSPEYAARNSELIKALNPQLRAGVQSQITRINWEASPLWKKVHRASAKITDPVFEAVSGTIKENSESLTYKIALGQAANLWDEGVKAALAAKDKGGTGAMYQAAKAEIGKALAGVTGSAADIADLAMSLTKSVETGKPLAGYDRFAINFAHQMVSRYDPKNVPLVVRNLGRVVPGTSQFFNPLSIGLYRLFAAGHSLAATQGRNASHVGVALATVGALAGFAYLWQNLSDQTGMSSFSKLNPVAGWQTLFGEDKQAELKNLLTAPSIRGGTMGDRLLAELFFETTNLVSKWVQSSEDGTTDTAAMNDSIHKSSMRILDLALQTGPVPLFNALRDIFYSPAKIGWTAIWGDDNQLFSELVQMDEKDELQLTVAPAADVDATDEEIPAARAAFKLLTLLTPTILRKDIPEFSTEELLAYLAKEKAIPLQFLYQMREARKKDLQEKEDLQQSLMTGKGSGKYITDPAERYQQENPPPPAEEEGE